MGSDSVIVQDIGAEARTPFPEWVKERTVPELLARCVAEAPDRVALIAESALSRGEERLTYAELADRAARVAGGLARLGVGHSDRVAFLVSNHAAIEAHLGMHACFRLGAIIVPINVRSLAEDVGWCVESTGTRLLIYEPAQAEKAAEVLAARPELAGVVLAAEADGERVTPWPELAAAEPAPQAELGPADGAGWVFTSGTTGYPKTVAHSHSNCVVCGVQIAEAWDLHPGDIYLNGHPFFTASGAITSPMAALWARATHIVEPSFDVEATLERVQRLRPTVVFWMTPALALILAAGDALERADLSSVRRVLYGGQAMSTEFHLELDDRLGVAHGIELVHMIGQSEAGPTGIMVDPEYHRAKPGAVGNRGYSRKLTEYALLDPDGNPVGKGEEGELCYRTPGIMLGYVGAPEATREVIHGGWLHSGDLCRYDEDGFVYFVDRNKDVIRRGGVNIASAEVERVIMDCDGVKDVAAVPHPHAVLGEVVKVVVVPEHDRLTAEQVIEYAKDNLADFKVPRVVEFIDELPRNDMGKVQKSKLRG